MLLHDTANAHSAHRPDTTIAAVAVGVSTSVYTYEAFEHRVCMISA
jgi:hypothetical protein